MILLKNRREKILKTGEVLGEIPGEISKENPEKISGEIPAVLKSMKINI